MSTRNSQSAEADRGAAPVRVADGGESHSVSRRHLAGLIVGALCIAFAPIFAVLSGKLGGVGMLDAAFWRVFLGALTMGAVLGGMRLFGKSGNSRSAAMAAGGRVADHVPSERLAIDGRLLGTRGNRGWWWLPGLFFAGDFWVWHWSFEHTSVANSTLLANNSIIIVTIFAVLVWKEVLTRRFVGGALVAFAGAIVLMVSSAHREPPVDGNPVIGDFLALATACFYASYQLSMKWYRQRRSAPLLMFWASSVAAIVLLPVALLHDGQFLSETSGGWWALVGLGALSHAGGQGLIAWSLGGLKASVASVSLLIQPVATALLGVAILGQPLVALQMVGGAAVLLGLFVAIRAGGRRKRPVAASR